MRLGGSSAALALLMMQLVLSHVWYDTKIREEWGVCD